jgi:phage/plasmid-like protein (TIGR03299 family)
MTADISFVNGRAEAFTSLRPAWWDRDSEYVTDHHLTSEEIWGDRGLFNFTYEKRPVYDEHGNPVPGFFRTVRADTNHTVGCGVTDRYTIVQPRAALGWMDSLMMDGVMRYASAGVLKGGRDLWILGVIPDAERSPIAGETHHHYVLWTDRFDGGGTLKWFPCSTRVECANTLSLALGERQADFKPLRHTSSIGSRLADARDAILAAKETFRRYNAGCLKLISSKYTRDTCREYIAQLFPAPLDPTTKRPLEKGRAHTSWQNKIQEVRTAFVHPANTRADMVGTYYQLFNAITMAVDHGRIFHSRGESQDRADNRFLNLMSGPGAELKSQAFELALQMAS